MADESGFVQLRDGVDSADRKSRHSSGVVDANTGTCSLPASSINLLKNIVGAGVLSLPAGVAAFSDDPAALAAVLCLAGGLGLLSAYTFVLVGKVCAMSGAYSYPAVFIHIWGEAAGGIPEVIVLCKLLLACLMYSVVLGDMMTELAETLGFTGIFSQREALLVVLHIAVLLPLALLRSLSALVPFSTLGVLGTTWTAGFMAYRLFQGAYAVGGAFADVMPVQPSFSRQGTDLASVSVILSMLATAYLAHYNAPRFLRELREPSQERFVALSLAGFSGATLLNGAVATFGFLTFGGSCQGNILSNYAANDALAGIARLGVLTSVLTGYPLVLGGFRDGLLELYSRHSKAGWQPSMCARDATTCSALAFLLAASLVTRDLGLLVALGGAIFASCIVYLMPALMFLGLSLPKVLKGNAGGREKVECFLSCMILVVGTLLAVIGAYESAKKEG